MKWAGCTIWFSLIRWFSLRHYRSHNSRTKMEIYNIALYLRTQKEVASRLCELVHSIGIIRVWKIFEYFLERVSIMKSDWKRCVSERLFEFSHKWVIDANIFLPNRSESILSILLIYQLSKSLPTEVLNVNAARVQRWGLCFKKKNLNVYALSYHSRLDIFLFSFKTESHQHTLTNSR